jgi:NAD(P) transhydrogenase subunit alpha
MNGTMVAIWIFTLSCFVGYYVIWGVTAALHTPLMAVTNAISAIVVVGAMLVAGSRAGSVPEVIGFLAVLLASINIFGGFVVTNRMLAMFRKKER